MQLHDQFDSINIAWDRIKAYVLDHGESYKTVALDKKRYIIRCKDGTYKFRIRATRSKKETVSTNIFKPHSCSPAPITSQSNPNWWSI
jgi:MuDR family transposase